jgi:hypothetical protein
VGRRLFRGLVKLGVLAGIVGVAVVIGKKLMGGLGPEPGSELAPKEWPSLVPEPAKVDATAASGNGSNGTVSADAGAAAD